MMTGIRTINYKDAKPEFKEIGCRETRFFQKIRLENTVAPKSNSFNE